METGANGPGPNPAAGHSDGPETAGARPDPRNPTGGPSASVILETYRAYLLLIANRELSPSLRSILGASDLVHETLIEAQQSLGNFAGGSEARLLAWLKRILLNNVADAARRYERRIGQTVSFDHALDGDSSADSLVNQFAFDDPSPSQKVLAEEDRNRLMQAVERLPEDLKQLIRMRNFELLTFEEIGERLGRSAGTVCRTWYQAIERLQRELGDTSDGGR